MVSTRQMATSNGGNTNSNNNNNNVDESTRLPVVTRQVSSNYLLVKCYSASQRSLIPSRNVFTPATAVATGSNTAPGSSGTVATRHSVLTQAAKAAGDSTNVATSASPIRRATHLYDLPPEILTKILKYVGYKRIGHLRMVSSKLNDICVHILNSTFSMLIAQTYNRFQAIKANMPRRESARRNHPLACECDIVETCYMRLSLLQMTFSKHIERGHCCFFPGAILEEVYTILDYIKNTPRLERPFRVTDELFDLSTMAMEYFRDRIEPTLPGFGYYKQDFFKLPNSVKRPALVVATDLSESSDSLPSPPQSNMVLRKGIRKIKQGMKIYNNQLSVLRCELRTCKRKSSEQGKQMAEQQKLMTEQQKQTLEYANRLDENDKKNEEMSRKFSTLLQELNKCKTELQYWRSKSPAMPTCTTCGLKVAPILPPPEDYQALINQGVKPEDIILNLNDETDAESDISSLSENSQIMINDASSEFAFPDESTTAQLLAVNTATKNLKRHYTMAMETETSNNAVAIPITAINDTSNHQQNVSGNIEKPIATAEVKSDACEVYNELQEVKSIAGGYTENSFYGNNINTHKGVIVSPAMLLAKTPAIGNALVVGANTIGSNAAGGAAAADFGDDKVDGGEVAQLQSLAWRTTHETKKARRVQKSTTRCLNSNSGKRSK